MSEEFIPLNQSTPVQQKWQPARNHHQRYQNHNHSQNGHRRGGQMGNNKWGNSSRSSFGSNSSNTSFGQDNRNNIDAYLHPSMLQDPWANLRQANQAQQQ